MSIRGEAKKESLENARMYQQANMSKGEITVWGGWIFYDKLISETRNKYTNIFFRWSFLIHMQLRWTESRHKHFFCEKFFPTFFFFRRRVHRSMEKQFFLYLINY